MPFNLYNAPATFYHMFERVVSPLINGAVLGYLKDVFIYVNTLKKLTDTFATVLKLLAKACLKCKATKCSLFI